MELSDLLIELFHRHGDATALRVAGRDWSYAELDRLTGVLAARVDRACPAGRRVLVVGEHSAESVIWALAAMRSRAIYTPMTPGLPAERFADSLRVAEAGLVACFDRETVVRAEENDVRALHAGDVGWPPDEVGAGPHGSRIAYSIFTSGSTGKPKLVDVGHGGLLNLCRSLERLLDIKPGEEVVQFASLSFDASITEMLGTLYAGATLVVPVWGQSSWLGSVSKHIAAHGCDLIMAPPSVYARFEDAARRRIKKIEFAGEALGEAEFAKAVEHTRVFNAYGPTEATVCFSVAELKTFTTTIGRPIDGFKALVHDQETGTHSTSGTGELVIVGDGVALGYVGARPDDREVFATLDGERAYYTGDRVALADGELSYLGRIDEQVKRFGHRVNLVHVESSLSARLGRPVALVQAGDEIVLATTADGASEESVMADVRSWVPAWEAPDRIAFVTAFPLATSGKLDKNTLREQIVARPAIEDDADLRRVIDVVTAVLGHEIDHETSIFEAGGNSLAMMRIQVKLSEAYGEQVVEAAFDAMEYDFAIADFLRHLRGEQVIRDLSPVEAVLSQAESELAGLRAGLPVLRRETSTEDDGRVLLTGASGFIGGHVLERLLAEGRPALVVSTGDAERVLADHRARFGRAGADYAAVRVISYAELESWVEQRRGPAVSAVVHCGYEVNHLLPLDRQMSGSVHNTVRVIRGAAAFGARSFAFLSAASAGDRFIPLSAETLEAIGDPYSRSKLICESYVDTLTALGCAVAHYRAGLVYGHEDGDRGFLKGDWFTGMLELATRLGAMPRLAGYVPICDVRELTETLLSGRGHSEIVVHRTYELAELLAHAGLAAPDVRPPAEWFDLAKESGEADPPLLAAMQSALGGRGWQRPARVVERDILADLLGVASPSN